MNYLLIYPDEMRAESLGCYGNKAVRTPNIDMLAGEGVLFEQNYTQHPVCGPSRACLSMGWYPHVDGRRTLYSPDETHPNLFRPIQKAGYFLCHAGKDDMFTRDAMPKIFDEIIPFRRPGEPREATIGMPEIGSSGMLKGVFPEKREEQDQRYTDGTKAFLKKRAEDKKPFFLMLSLFNPHPPYTALKSYYDMISPEKIDSLRSEAWLRGKPELYGIIREYRHHDRNTEEFYRKINAVYLGMISYVDTMVGQIIQCLKDNGLYEDTTLIFCSDHGDFAGDAGLVEKWPSAMDDMITRVPLIIRRPGAPGGRRITTPTQSIDILPTVCDYTGAEIDYDQFGISLRPQIDGAAGDQERAVYCEGGYDIREPQCFEPVCFAWGKDITPMMNPENQYYPKLAQQQEKPDSVCRVLMQRWKNWKLNIRTNGQNELYDMNKDPKEYHNLYDNDDYAEIKNQLILRALTWLISTSDVVPREGRS